MYCHYLYNTKIDKLIVAPYSKHIKEHIVVPQVARQEAIKNLAQPLLVDIVLTLAEEGKFDIPAQTQPRCALAPSTSAEPII